MKSFAFISLLLIGSLTLYYWDSKNQEESDELDEVMKQEIKKPQFKAAMRELAPIGESKLSLSDRLEISKDYSTYIPRTDYELNEYPWGVAQNFGSNQILNEAVVKMLSSYQSAIDQGATADIITRPEIVEAITLLNDFPEDAEKTLVTLLESDEILLNDPLVTHLLRIVPLVNCNKENVSELASQIISNENINQAATHVLDLDSKYQLAKINEATRIVIASKQKDREESVNYARKRIIGNEHPLSKHEVISQLSIYYPLEAELLENELLETEKLNNYLIEEAGDL